MSPWGARTAALCFGGCLVACLRVPVPVAAEFCAQSPQQSHFAPDKSARAPKCCLPRPPMMAKSGSAVEERRCH
ncbi:MAG TPA: hypothetical protein VF103_07515 [Polyangiaceae bacterium]